MGLGVAGVATARALADSGAEVLAWDDGEAGRKAAAAGIAATDLGAVTWSADLPLILSPRHSGQISRTAPGRRRRPRGRCRKSCAISSCWPAPSRPQPA